jgi:hypothetical protein
MASKSKKESKQLNLFSKKELSDDELKINQYPSIYTKDIDCTDLLPDKYKLGTKINNNSYKK